MKKKYFLLDQLINKLISYVNLQKRPFVIALAGAGCLGKTTFAKLFIEKFGTSHCQKISLDGYMLERKKRELTGLTGYNPKAFELIKAKNEIKKLIKSKSAYLLYQYNRQNHQRDLPELIEPKGVYFIEGGLCLRKELFSLIDLPLFLNANKKVQLDLRYRREKKEFKYNLSQVAKRFVGYFRDYKKFILPQKKKALLVIQVNNNYQLSITKNKLNF